MKLFHWSSLGATSAMVVIMVGAAWMTPAPSGTSVAQAYFSADDFVTASARNAAQNAARAKARAAIVAATDVRERTATDEALAAFNTSAGAPYPKMDYDLDAVLLGTAGVPRLSHVSMPEDLARIRETSVRKAAFFKTVLPLVLQVNEQIAEDRARLMNLRASSKYGESLDALDRLWLAVMAERYGVDRDDVDGLLARHDEVPPSLALAQAATESAWGTSRFVREGNAMFGQWTFSAKDKGIVPNERLTGQAHRVRAFDSLYDSVFSYVTNLNRHRAYKEFRVMRTAMRNSGQTLDGLRLASTLHRYSERGGSYVAELQAIISSNELDLLDGARLSGNIGFEPLI